MLLSAAEIRELTGYAKPALQCRWLGANGFKFAVRADGRPSVLRAAVEDSLNPRGRPANSAPDFSALER